MVEKKVILPFYRGANDIDVWQLQSVFSNELTHEERKKLGADFAQTLKDEMPGDFFDGFIEELNRFKNYY